MSSTEVKNAEEKLYESLSALMDGEASDLEIRRLLKSEDPELEKRWVRYNMIRSAMQGELQEQKIEDTLSLTASISSAIADEPPLSVTDKPSAPSKFWSNFARFGVAASVAGAVVIGVQLAPSGTDSAIATAPVTAPAPSASEPVLDPNTSVRVVSQEGRPEQKQPIVINEATRQQLQQMESEVNRLMLEHAQNASQHTQQGVLPYVRVPESE